MKKYNGLLIITILVYICFAFWLWAGGRQTQNREGMAYKVEIHEIMRQLEQGVELAGVDVSECRFVKEMTTLSAEASPEELTAFFDSANGVHSQVLPLAVDSEIKAYVRFEYIIEASDNTQLWLAESFLLFAFVLVMALLWYIKIHILKPFHTISELPYELSKGHLKGGLEENKNRFFGRFLWGLSMLRDSLNDSKAKELKLLKEKKLLLLSISHDIKIPLSAIKLYAKALKEEVYDTEEKRQKAAAQIEAHAGEIETFVKEIVSASSEDIITIEVEMSDFYLKDYVEKIHQIYLPKAQMTLTELEIGAYENRLLKGDMDRAFEVMENLLENAFKYGDGRRIKIDFYEEDYCQVIRVFNTGEAVPLTELPHLFDSFYRGSNVANKPGNGLGLYISRQIMNKMEGEIFAERQEDGMSFGVVFRLE